jgi:hypothetical protein
MFSGDALLGRRRRPQLGISPELEQSVLDDIQEASGGTIDKLAYVLDTPGAIARALLAGQPERAFASADERVSGRDLLKITGLIPEDTPDDWASFAIGTAAELALDPLAMLSGPAKALTTAGKAAKKLNLLDDAARVASKKYLDDTATKAISDRASKYAGTLGREVAPDIDLYARPLVGKRAAQRYGTLEDLIQYADDAPTAEREARALLGADYDKIIKQNLSGDVGVSLPFGDPFATFNVPGGAGYTDALDSMGRAFRWSPAGRLWAAGADVRAGGAFDAEGQILNRANFERRATATKRASGMMADAETRLFAGAEDAFTEEGNLRMGRLMEGIGNAEDLEWAKNPAVREYLDVIDEIRTGSPMAMENVGLSGATINDEFGLDYMPYQADAAFEMAGKRDKGLGRQLSTMTGDQMRRTDAMRTPGGREQIMKLSQDYNVSGPNRTYKTDEAAAVYLADQVFGKPYASLTGKQQKRLVRLARVLHRLPEDITRQIPLFGQHPVQMWRQYTEGRAGAIATAETLYDSLASFAVNTPFQQAPEGRHIPLAAALKKLGLRTTAVEGGEIGARQQMRQRLAKAFGVANPDDINLSQISIPQEHLDRMLKTRDAFTRPEVANDVVRKLDEFTQIWKGSILAWPARTVRDVYSGMFSNWLAGALDPQSMIVAKGLLANGATSEGFQNWLAQIPRYSEIADPVQRAAAFNRDLAASGLIKAGQSLDRTASITGDKALENVVGARPVTVGAIGEQLATAQWKGFADNPVLRAGEAANNFSDQLNRTTGYISLLSQGYLPEAAAKAIKRVQVDYSTLSNFERMYMRKLFPWYTFQSRIFGEVLQQLLERPGGRYGQAIGIMGDVQREAQEGTYIPSGPRSQFALPVGDFFGQGGDDVTRILYDVDVPAVDQINMIASEPTVAGSVGGTFRQIGAQLNPLMRVGTEVITGRDLYHDGKLGDSPSGVVSSAVRGMGGNPGYLSALGDRVVGNVPFVQRPAQFIGQLTDTRSGASAGERALLAGLTATTGLKIKPFSQAQIEADQQREILDSIDPFTRDMSIAYIPEALQPTVPQWALDREKVSKSIDKKRRKRSEKKKKPVKVPRIDLVD